MENLCRESSVLKAEAPVPSSMMAMLSETISGSKPTLRAIPTEMHSNDASPINAFDHRHSESSLYEESRLAKTKAPWKASYKS